MTIVLTFTNVWGKQEEAKFEDDELKIALLKKQITDIDLSPLIDCSSLQTLSLSFNLLRTIELSPLASCTNLQELRLRSNRLQSIELSPLASCTNLLRLSLGLNQLQIMNLTPLSACTRLQILDLNDNQLRAIELTPLSSCTGLQNLSLERNLLRSIDLTPLAACTGLQRLWLGGNAIVNAEHSWLQTTPCDHNHLPGRYERPTGLYPWSFLNWVVEHFGTDRRVQQDILVALGLKDYGFIDCDLSDLFLSIPADTPVEIAREQVRKELLEEIIRAVDRERTTTGLKLEDLSSQHGEIARGA
jgi:hypothetical protein